MTATMHLWPEAPREHDGLIRASARLELGSGGEELLWYDYPAEHRESLTDDADPYVVALALRMAQESRPVRVHGRVSPSLLRNLEQYVAAWAAWRPDRYAPIEIAADDETEREPPAGPPQAVCSFSGGIDSSFTAYRHAKGVTTRFPEPLTAGVMVRGFDIPLEQTEMFVRASEKVRRQFDSLGLELIPVATSFRSLGLDWVETFGAAVASVMMLLGRRFSRGLIAQGVPFSSYEHLVEGSNPLTDPLLSSDGFRVIPDGAESSRIDKVRAIAAWPEALEELRVCARGREKDRNCCRCEKCIRSILSFRALGLPRPACFPREVSDEQIRGLIPIKKIKISVGYDPIVRTAESHGLGDAPWVERLRRAIRSSRLHAQLSPRHRGTKLWRLMRRLRMIE